mgnify:FL=1
MGLLVDRKILFVHIPKTAGTLFVQNCKTAYSHGKCNFEGAHTPLYILHKNCKSIDLNPDIYII